VAGSPVLTIGDPAQLKALGHPLRLRVLEELGESGEELTNRELAQRLGVDPGHLHFHVRMLLQAGLIELAERGTRREKPYRAVAAHVQVAPELLTTGAANDARAVMLEDVRQGWARYAGEGRFRSANITARISEEDVREIFAILVAEAEKRERPENEAVLITLFVHPHPKRDDAA
jgi:DNA-binding transcriptional ArsR family regulator